MGIFFSIFLIFCVFFFWYISFIYVRPVQTISPASSCCLGRFYVCFVLLSVAHVTGEAVARQGACLFRCSLCCMYILCVCANLAAYTFFGCFKNVSKISKPSPPTLSSVNIYGTMQAAPLPPSLSLSLCYFTVCNIVDTRQRKLSTNCGRNNRNNKSNKRKII